MATSTISDNSWQSPTNTETGGATWHKVADPTVGWLASKTSGWTADNFSSGLEVDFSSVVPAGTKAVRVFLQFVNAGGRVYARKAGDSNISNTPDTSTEYSAQVLYGDNSGHGAQVVLWLSSGYKVDIAVTSTSQDVYVAYPVEYLL